MEVLKSLTCLQEAILADAGMVCSTSIDRDLVTLRSRIKHEGLSFVTITLPNFVKTFFRCLEQGKAAPSDFPGFHCPKGQCLPAFLQGFTGLVFNLHEGELLDTLNIDAVDAIRQIGLSLSKVRVECTRARNKKAERSFIECEKELTRFRWKEFSYRCQFGSVAGSLYGSIFRELDSLVESLSIVPNHGPGSTEDRTIGNAKWNYPFWTHRLERFFPSDTYCYANFNEFVDSRFGEDRLVDDFERKLLVGRQEPPVRVVFVPKTLKSPRVIAIEPVHNQYVQQGIMKALVQRLESKRSPVFGHVNFSDQSINGSMALKNSQSREFCTIDLSEASDRVHSLLAFHLFDTCPSLRKAIFSCRSKYAKLPSGQVLALKKFASMGSALCFPVEAMVFNAICVSAILVHRGLSTSCKNVRSIQKDVFVFGDDLIVPSREVDVVSEALVSAGLKVNVNKTFVKSHFRESCGVDAYNGVKISPVYIRELPPQSKRDASKVVSWISTRNLFYRKGYWMTSRYIQQYVERITGVVPHVLETSPALGWYSYLGSYSASRWNKDLHRFEVKGMIPSVSKSVNKVKGYRSLHKYFTERMSPKGDPLQLDAYDKCVKAGSLHIKVRWVSAA